jgi:2-iminobutanoate/2-iminopropanoate deaminase
MKHTFLIAALFLLSTLSYSQNDTVSKKKWHWGSDRSDTSAGYTQAVLVDNILYISGSVGRGNTMADQLRGTYSAIERTLKAHGLTFQNVVKENLYTTDIESVKQNNDVRKAFYKGDFPAATWVQITRLYMSTALVEVEVIAHLPRK